jgi:DNA-binding response OmpR family regulator
MIPRWDRAGDSRGLPIIGLAVKVLVVEDEKKSANYLRKGLSVNGFVLDVAVQGEDGLQLATIGDYDLPMN